MLPVRLAAGLPVVRAEGGGTIAESAVQQRAVLREQVRVGRTGGLRVAGGGEHGAVGRRRGGGLSRHLLVGRQLQRRQKTWRRKSGSRS